MAGPYLGLRSFDVADRHLFHGRERDAATVRALWESSRLVVLYGQSGVGKTSLLRAGVLPLLQEEQAEVLPVGRVSQGSAFPTTTMPNHNPYTFALLSSWSQASSPAMLSGVTIAAFLRSRPPRRDRFDDPIPLYGAIDQFEELFSDLPHRASYREEFIDQLREAADAVPRLRLLLSIREDVAARLLPYENRIVAFGQQRYAVQPLRRSQALAAVTGPLRGTDRTFAPGVAERLVDDLRTSTITNSLGDSRTVQSETVEPSHLQLVCTALWDALPDDVTVISYQHLQDHGNVDNTLGKMCAAAISEVAARHGLLAGEVWNWLKSSFITELGTRGLIYEGISTTAGMPNSVARELTRLHLLKVEERAGSRWYELLHDRLIEPIRAGNRPWPNHGDPVTPNRLEILLRTAETALAEGDLPLAERYAAEALRVGGAPESGSPRIRAEAESFLAVIATARHHAAEAEDRLRTATAIFDSLGDLAAGGRVLAKLGRLLLDNERAADAADALGQATARLPGDVELRTLHARALWRAGQPQAAIGVLTATLSIELAYAPALALRGVIQAEAGPTTAAIADLEQAIRIDPELAADPEVVAARELALRRLGPAA